MVHISIYPFHVIGLMNKQKFSILFFIKIPSFSLSSLSVSVKNLSFSNAVLKKRFFVRYKALNLILKVGSLADLKLVISKYESQHKIESKEIGNPNPI